MEKKASFLRNSNKRLIVTIFIIYLFIGTSSNSTFTNRVCDNSIISHTKDKELFTGIIQSEPLLMRKNLFRNFLEVKANSHFEYGFNSGIIMKNFGLDIWGDENFIIQNDTINVNHASKPSLISITQEIREKGYKGPLLLRFPQLLAKPS